MLLLGSLYTWHRVMGSIDVNSVSSSRSEIFYILTRPLGAVVGDLLDKPLDKGAMALSRFTASFTLLPLIALAIFFFPQRAARRAH